MPKKEQENKLIVEAFSETDKRTGEVVHLTPNSNNTVQPVALMRLGLFVPTLKSTANGRKNQLSTMDVTNELKQLTIVKAEGYENIKITGARLDMDNDFKAWVGIIHAFAKYKVLGDSVTLPFVDFAKLCGIPSLRSSAKLRTRLEASLTRIATNTIHFANKEGEYYVTHLVQSAKYSVKNDTVTLQADPKIFELYQFDRKVLLQLRAINELARKESAQALYTFIESLPTDPAPISMQRLQARLNLTSRPNTQYATVRRAMEQLKEIGYLDYTEFKRGNTIYFSIHYRQPKLRAANIPIGIPGLAEDDLDSDIDLEPVKKTTKAKPEMKPEVKKPKKEAAGQMVMLSEEEMEMLEILRKNKLKK